MKNDVIKYIIVIIAIILLIWWLLIYDNNNIESENIEMTEGVSVD
jgi:hypothetical protein